MGDVLEFKPRKKEEPAAPPTPRQTTYELKVKHNVTPVGESNDKYDYSVQAPGVNFHTEPELGRAIALDMIRVAMSFWNSLEDYAPSGRGHMMAVSMLLEYGVFVRTDDEALDPDAVRRQLKNASDVILRMLETPCDALSSEPSAPSSLPQPSPTAPSSQ